MPRKDARRKRQRAKVVASRSDSAHDARVLARHSASMARRSGAAAAPRGGGSGPCVVAVEATSRFAGRADVWWTPRCAASAALVVFATCVRVVEEEEEVVAAATTAAAGGDKYEDVGEAFEVARARGDAIGAVVVDERLPRDALFSFHIEVSSSLSSSSSTSSSSSSCSRTSSRSSAAAAASGRSRPIKISPARFSWAPMKKVNLWRGDCEALRRYIESPRIATWCANEHLGVLRALHSRGLGLLATPRLAVAAHDRSPSLFAAQRAACGCESAMRLVLRFATPLCLPTTDELQDMLAACMAGPEGAANFADFIDAGVDPNIIVDGSGGLPLIHLAAQRGDAKSVRRLLDAGARPPHRARGPGRTALCAAATGVSAGHTAVVEILLNARFSHINAMCRDEEGAEDGNVAVAVANDASNADGMHVEVPPPPLHLTALCAAARSGHLAAVKLLIAAGADTELVVTRSSTVTDREGGGADVDSSCVTPLCYAARSGHADVVSNLIEAGARYKHTDFAPLCDAAAGGHAEVVTLLCERGVDPNEVGIVRAAMPPADATALLAAARNGHAAVVELLLASGANVNRGALEGGYTPIWCAAESNRGACVAILLASGADVEREVNVSCGGTPLVVAARMGHAAIVTQLLDAGAHADYTLPRKSRGEEGWTLAHRVCPYTALHAAAEKGHHDAVLALLVAGADKKIRNGNGQTAVVVAECEGHTPLVHLLSATNPSHDRARKERKMGRKWVLERAEAKPLPLFVRGEELVGNIVWVPPEEKTNEGWEKVNVKGYLPDREFPYQIVFLWSGNPDHNTGDEDEWERADFDAARCMPTHPPLTTSSAFDEIEERLEELFEVADNNDDDDDVEVEESRGGRSGSEGSGSASNVASTAGQSPTTKAKVIHEVSNRLREVAPASSGPIVGERALDLLARKVSKAGGTVDDAVDICRRLLVDAATTFGGAIFDPAKPEAMVTTRVMAMELREIFSNKMHERVTALPAHERYVLCALAGMRAGRVDPVGSRASVPHKGRRRGEGDRGNGCSSAAASENSGGGGGGGGGSSASASVGNGSGSMEGRKQAWKSAASTAPQIRQGALSDRFERAAKALGVSREGEPDVAMLLAQLERRSFTKTKVPTSKKKDGRGGGRAKVFDPRRNAIKLLVSHADLMRAITTARGGLSTLEQQFVKLAKREAEVATVRGIGVAIDNNKVVL